MSAAEDPPPVGAAGAADAPGVDILVEDLEWRPALQNVEAAAARAARAALESHGLAQGDVALTLLLADDIRVAALNDAFRGKPQPTNVLSWPSVSWSGPAAPTALVPHPFFLGDVALARETIIAEAQEAGRALEDHLAHLTIHGVLHLLGFDHETDEDAAAMAAREIAALAAIGVSDPYAGEASEAKRRAEQAASMEEDRWTAR